jgi:protein TonB
MLRVDLIAAAVSLVLHTGVAVALSNVSGRGPPRSTIVSMSIKAKYAPPPAPITSPEHREPRPERPSEPPVKKRVRRVESAQPRKPAVEPSSASRKPIFGLESAYTTSGESSVAVHTGDTTTIDPNPRAEETVGPLPLGPRVPQAQATADESTPMIKTLPGIDSRACGKLIAYPDEAEQLGIEGDVTLRVALDAAGRVERATVLRGLGHGLDRAAVYALKNLCRFTPAIATDGKPVPYVIDEYTFHFEIPR